VRVAGEGVPDGAPGATIYRVSAEPPGNVARIGNISIPPDGAVIGPNGVP